MAETTHTRNGGQLLVESLLSAEVPLLTCVPGESFLPILDAIYELRAVGTDSPRLVTARHEAAAANMAEAAGKLTGVPAACFVTRGPGAMHASIAVHTAFQDGTPMLLVVGQVAQAVEGREAFQEMDYRAVFGTTAKDVVELHTADRIPEHVARALHVARSGRPGPVVLVAPEDVLAQRSETAPYAVPDTVPVAESTEAVTELAYRLEAAERPVFIVGGPGWNQQVANEVAGLAEEQAVPLAAAFRWQDAVDNRSAAYAGYLGLGCSAQLRRRVAEADLLVAFGPRLDDPTTAGYSMEIAPERLVLVSEDPRELTRSMLPGTAIHAGLLGLARGLRDHSASLAVPDARRRWVETLRGEFEDFTRPVPTKESVDLAAIVRHVRDVLPDDAVVTNGAGNYTVWVQRFFEFRRYRTQLAPRNGAMGYGLPAALAASALRRVPVVAFAGDGCAQMSGHELATAVQEGLPIILVVVNNRMYGTIRMHQERQYPDRVIATELRNPDFVAYAESFGALGRRVDRTEDFPDVLAEALASSRPTLIEVRADERQLTPDVRL